MVETVSVSLSGTAFSYLLYENVKNTFAQEGFLLGDIIIKKTSTITDNEQRQLNVSRVIKVNSVMPCPRTCYFYDGIGKVDTKKIKNFLGDLTSNVVAWYKYRPSGGFTFTFRERIIHKQLSEMFEIPSEFFTCWMLISESSDNVSTHSFTQNFVRYHSNSFEQLPLHIVNLSDANNTYKSPDKVSETFRKILGKLNINHQKSQGLTSITKIQDALEKHTKNVVDELSEAEVRLFHLENETRELMKRRHQPSASTNHMNNSIDAEPESPVKTEHLNSASNKECHLNDDAKSVESNEPLPTKNARTRRKSNASKRESIVNQSSSKRNSAEGMREISTRSRKRN